MSYKMESVIIIYLMISVIDRRRLMTYLRAKTVDYLIIFADNMQYGVLCRGC